MRCLRGAAYDVVADLRPHSPTYRRWQAFQQEADDAAGLYIPEGCAHGFLTLTDGCDLLYQISAAYQADSADGVRFDDPALGIVWPRPVLHVADRDLEWPPLTALQTAV